MCDKWFLFLKEFKKHFNKVHAGRNKAKGIISSTNAQEIQRMKLELSEVKYDRDNKAIIKSEGGDFGIKSEPKYENIKKEEDGDEDEND